MNHRAFLCLTWLALSAASVVTAFAASPTVTVTSPANNAKTTSPVHFVATASSPQCAQGISAMRIYSAPGVDAYTVAAGKLNSFLNLPPATYHTVVVAWDNCGGVGSADVTITTTSLSKPAGFVYTVNSDYFEGNTVNNVVGFTIVSGNGALAQTGQGPVKANVDPISVASDLAGDKLYVGDYVSGDVFAYSINRTNGYLTPVPGSPFPVNRSVTAVAVHPSGTWVYATRDEQAAGDGVAAFQVQSNGSLVAAPGSPYTTQLGPQALVVDPSGNYLYVADASNYIDAFAINKATGALTPVAGSPFQLTVQSTCRLTGAFPTDVIDPVGKILYTADSFIDSISGFSITATSGALKQISSSPWADNGGCNSPPTCQQCAFNPYSIAIDGTGKFLYGVNSDMEDISIYAIGSSGTLTYIKNTGITICCLSPIRTDPAGNYLYTSGGAGVPAGYRGLVGFSINHTTADLTPMPTSPFTYPAQSQNEAMQAFTVTH